MMVVGIRHDRMPAAPQTQDRSAIIPPISRSRASRFRSIPLGELPPPPPRACFGRDELIEEIVGLAETFAPIALIGTGGIGKTSIALTVLHHDRIEERFGVNRRFVRCDQFPATSAHFLRRLSKVIGAGAENPEDLVPLRRFLSSKEVLIILDNAESVLDPQGTDAREIYALVDELCQIKTVCLCITSRITTVPRHCKRLTIPTLSMEAACDTFYGIYDDCGRSRIIDGLLRRLDFHPLSITLLATTASHNMWDYNRLEEEWDIHRAQVLRIDYNESLAATIELSLTSPTFLQLGPDARDLLGIVAFFPQGIDENNLDWLFPTTSNRKHIFDKFCVLSLTRRNNGFVTMLAPIRDYLRPQDPESSPLLRVTRDHYFSRLSVDIDPHMPGFGEARWITSEDVNVEHLLDIFASINTESDDVWLACIHFLRHLFWHKQRHTVLASKIELLPHDHPFKMECSYELSRLFYSVGKYVEQKRLLTYILALLGERGDDYWMAQTLQSLSGANLRLGHHGEGIEQAEEALELFEQLGHTKGQAWCLNALARLFHGYKQLEAAEETAIRVINLFPQEDEQFLVCQAHRILGDIYHSKGDRGEAIQHFEIALGVASAFDWNNELFWTRHSLALLFFKEGRFDDAHAHIEQAKSHAVNNSYDLGCAVLLQARIWHRRRRFKEARSEAFRALDIFENLGASECMDACKALIRVIGRARKVRPPLTSTTQIPTVSPMERMSFPTAVNSPLARGASHDAPANTSSSHSHIWTGE